MKKIILFFILLSSFCLSTQAQVQFHEGSLKEALSQAQKENKKVMVICSATWCGPCKYLTDKILSQKECSDFLDNKVIIKKYYLDKSDPDKIVKTYNIKAFPTLLLFNAQGEEVNRNLGGSASTKDFIKKMNYFLDDNNSWQAQEAKLDADPSYAITYSNFLVKELRMGNEAIALLLEMFNKGLKEEYFTQKNVDLYKKLMPSRETGMSKFFIENSKTIIPLMGEQAYKTLMDKKARSFVMQECRKSGISTQQFAEYLREVNANKYMRSKLSRYLQKDPQMMVEANFDTRAAFIRKGINSLKGKDRFDIIRIFEQSLSKEIKNQKRAEIINLFSYAIGCEKKGDVFESLKRRQRYIINNQYD